MARGKKKEELTLEEKLEQALVPVEEQPYEVPENWCWMKLDNIASIKRGASPRPIKAYVTDEEGINWIKIGDSDSGKYINTVKERITSEGANKSVYVKSGTLLLSNSMSFGRPYILNIDGCIHDGWLAITPLKVVDKEFLYYAFLASNWYFEQVAVGTAVRNLNSKRVADLPLAIPPLQEQQRIVECIERLFAKLDEAKEKLQEVIDGYAIREAALLQKAVSGELTKEWREKNGISKTDWKTISLKECGIWFGGGTPTTSKKEYWDGGEIPWITSKDMKDRVIEGSLLHITQEGVNNSSARYCDKPAVLFVMRSGILRRILPVCMVKVPFTVNQDLKAVIPEKIQQEYMYWACTAYEKDIRENCMKSGTTVESIEAKKLLEYKLSLPNEGEQKAIVDIIENLVCKEESVKKVALQILEQIDVMKKSILAKAFRGELGTNNQEEESAIGLLKTILVE